MMDRPPGDFNRKRPDRDAGLDPNRRPRKKINKRKIIIVNVVLFVVCLGLILNGWALFDHVLPQEEIPLYMMSASPDASETPGPSQSATPPSETVSPTPAPEGIFLDSGMEKGELSYKSHDLNIQIRKIREYDTNIWVAEVYTRDSSNILSAFAQGKFGRSFEQHTQDMANENGAVIAISGDNYGDDSDKTGVIIRNGKLYQDKPKEDIMAIYNDGAMKTYTLPEIDTQKMQDDGVWQTYAFGPALMNDGKAIEDFTGLTPLPSKNPRTAVGQIEPNHFILLVTDGRIEGESAGLKMVELAKVFEELGCTAAYNLDGGMSSTMVFDGRIINQQPGGGERPLSDCLYFKDTP